MRDPEAHRGPETPPEPVEGPPSTGSGHGYQRILIYGVTGSGKSSVARRIAEATGLPAYSVDDICWDPDWVPVDPEEQRRRMGKICATDSWVLDSAYGQWRDVVLDRVDLIVGLDLPRWLSFGRLVRRTVLRIITREPVCNGNRETLRKALAGDSILWWHFRSFANKRNRMRAWADDEEAPDVVLLTRSAAVEAFLSDLRPGPVQIRR